MNKTIQIDPSAQHVNSEDDHYIKVQVSNGVTIEVVVDADGDADVYANVPEGKGCSFPRVRMWGPDDDADTAALVDPTVRSCINNYVQADSSESSSDDRSSDDRASFTAVGSIDVYPYTDSVLERLDADSLGELDLDDPDVLTVLSEEIGAAIKSGDFRSVEEFRPVVIHSDETGEVKLQ
jgi:hypothetical protein